MWHTIRPKRANNLLIQEAILYEGITPKDGQEVLVTTKDYKVDKSIFYDDKDFGQFFTGYEGIYDIIAWMPLPHPYKNVDISMKTNIKVIT